MTSAELDEQFAIPGLLAFDTTPAGLNLARITSPTADATVYLQGAHLAEWTPAGQSPVLYLSPRSELAPGKPIRGGIPVIFPWFGPGQDGNPGPAHGFARTSEWQLAFAAAAGDDLHLTFTLAPTEHSRELGFDHFGVALRMRVGRTLALEFTVANTPGGAPLRFEQALHTYFAVGDATQALVKGLAGAAYLDKRDEMKRKVQTEAAIVFTGTVDRVFLDTTSTCTIEDHALRRRVTIEKAGSDSTVVWNPWSTVAATLPDMDPEGWRTMVCVETANVASNAVTLAPGETHTLSVSISVEELA
ncbi:MAG: D-hexose-6-phosphate mutarotase [Acidobacteriota bacterium]|nr:D-hexose-6-phosphate mutarotase [Acidobacteriota bacterium]